MKKFILTLSIISLFSVFFVTNSFSGDQKLNEKEISNIVNFFNELADACYKNGSDNVISAVETNEILKEVTITVLGDKISYDTLNGLIAAEQRVCMESYYCGSAKNKKCLLNIKSQTETIIRNFNN